MYESLSDAQLLEKLYTENYSLIYRLVVHTLQQYVRTSADAADLTQEVFITAARKIDVLRDHPNPTGWLISTAYYQCKNHVRSVSRRREVPDDALILTESDGDAFASSDIRLSISQIRGKGITRCWSRIAWRSARPRRSAGNTAFRQRRFVFGSTGFEKFSPRCSF